MSGLSTLTDYQDASLSSPPRLPSSSPQTPYCEISAASMAIQTSPVHVKEQDGDSLVSSTGRSLSFSSSSPTPEHAGTHVTIATLPPLTETTEEKNDNQSLDQVSFFSTGRGVATSVLTNSAIDESSRIDMANGVSRSNMSQSTILQSNSTDGTTTAAVAVAVATKASTTGPGRTTTMHLQTQTRTRVETTISPKLQPPPRQQLYQQQLGEQRQEECELQLSPGQDIGQRRGGRATLHWSARTQDVNDMWSETKESPCPTHTDTSLEETNLSFLGSGKEERAMHPSERFEILERLGFG